MLQQAINLFRLAWFPKNGKYELNNQKNAKKLVIWHKNSKPDTYVVIDYKLYPTRGLLILSNGQTRPNLRGQKIGTELRALASIFVKMLQARMIQQGVWKEPGQKRPGNSNNRAPSTRILRNRLGWRQLVPNRNLPNFPNAKFKHLPTWSIFTLHNNLHKAKNILGSR
jgi:hypothetical protein